MITRFGLVGTILLVIMACVLAVVFLPVGWSLAVLWTLGVAGLFVGGLWLVSRFRSERVAFWVLAALLLVLQGLSAYYLQVEYATWDVHIVASSAINLAVGKKVYWTYFATYPNNLALLYLQGGVLTFLSWFGIAPSVISLLVLNILAIDVSVWLAVLITRQIAGARAGWIVGMMLCLYSPLCLYVPICYSDTFCMPFALGGLLMGMRAVDRILDRATYAVWGMHGVVAALLLYAAFRVKGSCIVVAVALILYVALRLPWRDALKLCFPGILSLVLFMLVFWGYTFNNTVTRADFERYEMPTTHWLAMGLNGKGNYGADDVYRMRRLRNVKKRKRAAWQLLEARVRELGFVGMACQLWKKATTYCWNYGTCYAERYLGDQGDKPVRRNAAHDWVLSRGKHHMVLKNFSSGIYLSVIILALLGLVQDFWRGGLGWTFCLNSIWAGGVVFFMLWETHPRYSLHLMPYVIILAAISFARLYDHFCMKGQEGRDPGPNFSTEGYLAANPDVAESGVNLLVHWEHHDLRLEKEEP